MLVNLWRESLFVCFIKVWQDKTPGTLHHRPQPHCQCGNVLCAGGVAHHQVYINICLQVLGGVNAQLPCGVKTSLDLVEYVAARFATGSANPELRVSRF